MDQHLHDDLEAAFGRVEHGGAAQIPSAAVTEVPVAAQNRFSQPNQDSKSVSFCNSRLQMDW